MVSVLKKSPLISFDLETTSIHPMKAEIVGVSFSTKEFEGYYIPLLFPNNFDSTITVDKPISQEFKSENFKADYNFVKKLEKKFNNCKIIKGYFKDSLKRDDIKKNINKISVAFIDCDIGFSAIDVFEFIKPRLSYGAFIMIDDYFNIDKTKNSILTINKMI